MSKFVRPSKYRHVFGQVGKKECSYDNVKVTNNSWDTNLVSASARYISFSSSTSGGFAILPAPSPFESTLACSGVSHKLPDIIPLALGYTGNVLDTAWSPTNDSIVASASDNGTVSLWEVPPETFTGWMLDGWEPGHLRPKANIAVSPRKVGHVSWHPTATNVLATASGDHLVKLWDLAKTELPRSVLTGHSDTIQSFTFNLTGTIIATTCRDKKIRLFDVRVGGDAMRVTDGHNGVMGTRVVWLGERDRIATTGFSKMSERQVAIWETGGLGSMTLLSLDQSAGVLMPFWSDNGILFLAGKGDGNIRYYELESDTLHPLSEYKSMDPQRGMGFLPRRQLAVSECEIARAFKLTKSGIEPIAFIVPRKSESLQSDIYPPAPSLELPLTAEQFFAGETSQLNLVDFEDMAVMARSSSTLPTTPSAISPTVVSHSPEAVPQRSPFSATLPQSASALSPPPATATATIAPSALTAASEVTTAPQVASVASKASYVTSSTEDVERLRNELREARSKIRKLELQVESMKANAQRTVQSLQTLLDA